MDKLKSTVATAKELNKFCSELRLLNPSEFDINDIISLKPDFDNTIQSIRSWIIPSSISEVDDVIDVEPSVDVVENETADEVNDEVKVELEYIYTDEEPIPDIRLLETATTGIETPVIEEPEKDIISDFQEQQQQKMISKTKYDMMSKQEKEELVENICYQVANRCDGMPRLKALKEITPLYQNTPSHVLRDVLRKGTFLHISDKYFSLDKDDNIVDTRHVINGRGVYYINGHELTESTFLKLKELLMRHNYSIKNLITDKIITTKADVMDCLRTKIIMNQNGDIVIGEEDLAIMISDVVDRVGKRKTTKIDQMLEKDWNITDISGNTISDIINKRIYREISDMFFA